MFGRLYRVDRWINWVFEASKDTKFLIPQLEMIARSEVKRSAASSLSLVIPVEVFC